MISVDNTTYGVDAGYRYAMLPGMDDLFGDVPQPIQFAPEPPRLPLTADDVRDKMLVLIATARGARAMPWDASELKHHIAMFPIMAMWLDPNEGDQLVLDFQREVARLRDDRPA